MKICIDLTSLADNFSGIERFAACISHEMIELYDDDFILVFKKEVHPMFKRIVDKPNVKSIVLPVCKKLLFNQIRLPWALRKVKADWYLFMAFPVPILLFKNNMVSTIHDICCWDCPDTMNGMSKWYFRISHKVALRKCRSIITISEFSRSRIESKLNYSPDNIWLIYCGIDDKFSLVKDETLLENVRSKYSLPEKYILSLSTLEPRKNIRLLIDAYRELVLSGSCEIPLVFAGRKGWKMDELMSGIEPKVRKMIVFTGFVNDDDLTAVYGSASIFVFPSMYEGFGIPPLEAMACGVPVISSDAASLPEVCGSSAIFFPNNDKRKLMEALRTSLMMSTEEIENKRFDGIQQARKFNWKIEAKKLREHLGKMS